MTDKALFAELVAERERLRTGGTPEEAITFCNRLLVLRGEATAATLVPLEASPLYRAGLLRLPLLSASAE